MGTFTEPRPLTEEELERCDKYFTAYMFVESDHKGGRHCVCSRCKESFLVSRMQEMTTPEECEILYADINYEVRCPYCGTHMRLKYTRAKKGNLYERHNFAFIRVPGDGSVRIECYTLHQEYHCPQSYPYVSMDMVYVLRPGEMSEMWYKGYYSKQWTRRREAIIEPFLYGGGSGIQHDSYRMMDLHLLEDTHLRYRADEKWNSNFCEGGMQTSGCLYLCALSQYPAVEILLKSGFYKIAHRTIMNGIKYYNRIDLKAKDLKSCLKLDGGEIAALRKINDLWTADALMARCKHRRQDGWEMQALLGLYDAIGSVKSGQDFCEEHKITPRELLRYIELEHARAMRAYERWLESGAGCGRGGMAPRKYDVWNKLCDYHQMSKNRFYRPNVALPRNIFELHDAMLEERDAEVRRRETERASEYQKSWEKTCSTRLEDCKRSDEKHKKNADKLYRKRIKELAYQSGDWMAVIPENAEALAIEGERMHHCVGTYGERFAKGDTHIVFIRHKERLDKPVLTVEIDTRGWMVQCYGFNDDRPISAGYEWLLPLQEEWRQGYDMSAREFAEEYKAVIAQRFAEKENKTHEKERKTA